MPQSHRGQFVQPRNTIALMDALGATRAARELGVSTTLLYTARKEGEVAAVVEKAAEGAMSTPLSSKPSPLPKPAPMPREDTVLCLIEVGKSKQHVIEKLAEQLKASILIH